MRDFDQFLNAMDDMGVKPLSKGRHMPESKAQRSHPNSHNEPISHEDSALFLNAVMNMGVAPKEDSVPEVERQDGPSFTKLRSAKKKKKKPDEFVDLHGMTVAQALSTLSPFVTESYTRGLKSATVITGKGLHSPGGRSVLKPQVERWIQTKGKRFIRAYADAPRAYGGRGAFIIYFRED